MNFRSVVAHAAALTLMLMSAARPVAAQENGTPPTRIVVVLKSSDEIIADLEHMVVGLADQQDDWENNVFPNIDIFLIGVDKAQPVRFDQLIAPEGGQRQQLMVPVADLNDFIKDNLDPIGIIVKRDRRDRDLYELSDVYEGWMRVKADYARFTVQEHPEDVPADMPDPSATHDDLLAKGYDVAAQLQNTKTTPEQRTAAFATYRDNTLAGIQKKPSESAEAFELRKANTAQTLETMERLFVQSSDVTIGWITDASKSEGRGEFLLVPIEGTELEKTVQAQAETSSYFANIATSDQSVLSGRLNVTLDELMTRQSADLYKLARPVAEQRIDETADITAEQKAARKEIAGLLLDMLSAGLDIGKWDGALEVTPADGGQHTALIGLRTADGSPMNKIVELLPTADSSYSTELNVETAGDVAIHKVTVTQNYPKALQQFFGDSGEFYIGAGPEAVWISIGSGALDAMKAGIEAVGGDAPAEVSPTIASLDFRLLPVLQVMNQLRKDGDFDLLETLKNRGVIEEPAASEESEEEAAPGAETAQMLKDFEWRDAALEALQGSDDRLHIQLDRVENRLEGDTTAATGLLKMIGELIAKFARENLG